MVFTARRCSWEAHSALAWEKQCYGVYVGLIQLAGDDQLFANVAPGEVNDSTKLVLEASFGLEW